MWSSLSTSIYFTSKTCAALSSIHKDFLSSFLLRLSHPRQRNERERVYFLLFVIHVLFMFTLEQEQSVAMRIHRVSVWCIISIKCISFSLEKRKKKNRKKIERRSFGMSILRSPSLFFFHALSLHIEQQFPIPISCKRPSITFTTYGNVCDTYSREIQGDVDEGRQTDRWSSREPCIHVCSTNKWHGDIVQRSNSHYPCWWSLHPVLT